MDEERNCSDEQKEPEHGDKVGIRERLKHFTWAWFTSTMSTGGLAIALAETPHKFRGLYTIGVIVYLFNIVLFVMLCACMTMRSIISPKHFKRSFYHPPEAFYFGSFWLSVCVILGGTQVYGVTYGPCGAWLTTTLRILYYTYAALSLLNSIQQYFTFVTRTPTHPIPFAPSWFLAGYSAMLTGTLASLIASSQPVHHRVPILISGLAYQGFGWLLSCILLVMYLYTLMETGLPPPAVRPGMFIPVGTTAYTIVVLIGLVRAIPAEYGWFGENPGAAQVLRTMALFVSVFLWLFSFWLFALAVLAIIAALIPPKPAKMPFALPWWAFVFPNVGFTLSTVCIGQEMGSEGILWVGSAMTVLLVAVWLFTAGMCVRAVVLGRICWPGRDEDGGMFKDE
ncbi:hypothetical protein CC80DRAFT_472942 [Byssothecium circinans]|uniref:C4-dicarboxylate transporter/malic acid transport protein n=1 Tax=Byssothecium circinans TaxID=147558 RepID=A0A6A5TTD6_9PLEO|nr:hypothetical protein CC80DRAFT_472942 [Byssothecium circinans]